MKRQKRDPSARAFGKGYQAGIAGRSRSFCPHGDGDARQQWLSGWREARTDHWDGLNLAAHVQKLNNFHHP
ncbi:ribosome modulation factor [Marinimicrobium sp. ARAG 43.8]|uniref:ribosome modulation factor n=1 Tax=Marinimicrobium sp. ARAG 43.8 TaxID=3418719 RepID=UPI003CF6ABF0